MPFPALFLACSTGTSIVASSPDNGLRPPEPLADMAPPGAFACEWPADDPGDLVATGAEPGDVAGELVLWDQCGDVLGTRDLYGRYVLVLAVPAGCEGCARKARLLGPHADDLSDELGVEVMPLLVLLDPADAPEVEPWDAVAFAEEHELRGYPVTADARGRAREVLPLHRSGGCALSPEQEILGCTDGIRDLGPVDGWIAADAGGG